MTNGATGEPPNNPDSPPPELAELDRFLQESDPQFTQGLETVRSVKPAEDVQIEASVGLDVAELTSEENPTAEAPKRWKRWRNRLRQLVGAWIRQYRTNLIIFFRTAPPAFALYLLAHLKMGAKQLATVMRAFFGLSRFQKLGLLVIAGLAVATFVIIKANLRGDWLPALYAPMLTNLGDHADSTYEFNPNERMLPFLRVFPQDPEIFLLDKFKVNLRSGPEHPMPMGAFEFYVQVDSHETAIEMQARQVEIHDLVSRVLEDQTYNDLASDLGKSRLKGLIKKEVTHALTQGWATDIDYKTFILKP